MKQEEAKTKIEKKEFVWIIFAYSLIKVSFWTASKQIIIFGTEVHENFFSYIYDVETMSINAKYKRSVLIFSTSN